MRTLRLGLAVLMAILALVPAAPGRPRPGPTPQTGGPAPQPGNGPLPPLLAPFQPAPAQAPPPLRASAAIEGAGLRFTIDGYNGDESPTLRLLAADGTDWSDRADPPERLEGGYTVKLRGEKGLARLAVENIAFAWRLPDGREAQGEVQYKDIRHQDVQWQITRTERLLIYHVRPLARTAAQAWETALDQVLSWTGQSRERTLVVWVFPSAGMLQEWAHVKIAGEWLDDAQRLAVHHEEDPVEQQVVMLHEMVHAVSPGHGPTWFEEGIAHLLEARKERLLAGNRGPRWLVTRWNLERLQALARQRPVATVEALGWNPDLATSSYTLGASVWLYVKHNLGEAGLQRFFAEGGSSSGVKESLEALFGKPLPEIWDDWNGYLRSEQLLEDWRSP